MNSKGFMIIIIIITAFLSCSPSEKQWVLTESINIAGVNPIGLAYYDNGLWLSDVDHNRVVKIDEMGNIIQSIDSLERPMHIAADHNAILIPQYGNDLVMEWSLKSSGNLSITDSLDAPAAVWRYKEETAIADFYHNRILYTVDGQNWSAFGNEGKQLGELYYPTDVQITEDAIYVADANNSRIQVFDKSFNLKQVIGKDQNMNAVTGIYVSDRHIFAADFENDRVLVFAKDGSFIQELNENIEKPTDVLLLHNKLYITNYRNSQINIFKYQEIVEK